MEAMSIIHQQMKLISNFHQIYEMADFEMLDRVLRQLDCNNKCCIQLSTKYSLLG